MVDVVGNTCQEAETLGNEAFPFSGSEAVGWVKKAFFKRYLGRR